MYSSGHCGAAATIITLVISTAFLVWAGGKTGNPYQKLAKGIGWVAVVLSLLLIAGSLFTCAFRLTGSGCPMMKGMAPMMEQGGPGMGMHHGMGQGMMPMQPPSPGGPEPEKK